MNDAAVGRTPEPPPPARSAGVVTLSSPGADDSSQRVGTGEEPRAVLDDRVCWSTVAGLSLFHAGIIAGLLWIVIHPSAATLVLAAVTYVLGGLAITAGYHRLFAHRTYRASAPVRWAMLVLGAGAFQNSALSWSADHRAHH